MKPAQDVETAGNLLVASATATAAQQVKHALDNPPQRPLARVPEGGG